MRGERAALLDDIGRGLVERGAADRQRARAAGEAGGVRSVSPMIDLDAVGIDAELVRHQPAYRR